MTLPKSGVANLLIMVIITSLFISSCIAGDNAPAVQDIEKVIYDKNYMHSCKENFTKTQDQQAGFQGIFVNTTAKDEVIAQFGQPTKIDAADVQIEYVYFDTEETFAYHFFIANGIVSDIHVNIKSESLRHILEEFGCPDLILSEIRSDDFFDSEYQWTILQYLKAGLYIAFDHYPISYSDNPDVFSFEEPLSLDSFLKHYFDPLSSELVSFSEATNNK